MDMNIELKPTVSIIIPVYNGGRKFLRCLESIAAASPAPEEIIVVADGESDGAYRFAEQYNAKIFLLDPPGGPAKARNAGAELAEQDILFFVDADVAISKNAVEVVKNAFRQNPDIAAVIGSYDDNPEEPNFLSQYKNLFHHYVHQTANTEASTFWAGCGAIRRTIFLEMGGFNEKFSRPSIEDIELGYRLTKAGYNIRLVKELQVKHLKRWGVFSLLRADFFYRALPWTNLILMEDRFPNDLNLKISNRISIVLAYLSLLSLVGALFIPFLWISVAVLGGGLVLLNLDIYRFFKNKKGIKFSLMVIPWHWLYFFYSGLAFLIGLTSYGMKKIKPYRHLL